MKLEQIDTSTTAGKAEVMRLAAEGRRVAYSARGAPGWYPLSRDPDYTWNWFTCDFAIIAEPVGPDEVWVVIGVGGFPATTAYDSRVHADRWVEHQAGTVVRYVRAD